MVLQQPFTTGTTNLASYDYNDLASGFAYEDFYTFTTIDSSGTNYGLVSNVLRSASIQENGAHDYDTTVFNIPRTINGTVYFTGSTVTTVYNSEGNYTISATLKRYNGSTYDTLGTATSAVVNSGTTTGKVVSWALEFDVSKTVIKKGEYLRLSLSWSIVGGGSFTIAFGTDPASRNGDYFDSESPSQSVLAIPFEIE